MLTIKNECKTSLFIAIFNDFCHIIYIRKPINLAIPTYVQLTITLLYLNIF